MSYNQNPLFMPAARPPSQGGYPAYGGPGMGSGKTSSAAGQANAYKPMYVVQGTPYQQIYPPGTEGSYPGGGRAGAEASAAQVMVQVPVYPGHQYMQPVRSHLISASNCLFWVM